MKKMTGLLIPLFLLCACLGSYAQETWCVIGDSISAPITVPGSDLSLPWPTQLQSQQPQLNVVNAAQGGATFYIANNSAVPALGGLTQVQYCISANPSKVIVMLGGNDAAINGQPPARNYTQVTQDIAAMAYAIQAGMPGAKVWFVEEVFANYNWYTSVGSNSPTTPLQNQQMEPFFWSDSVPTDTISQSLQNAQQGLNAINNFITSGLGYPVSWPGGNGAGVCQYPPGARGCSQSPPWEYVYLPYFSMTQAGGVASDGFHPTYGDAVSLAQAVWQVMGP